MRYIIFILAFLVIITSQTACSTNDPGPLAGTWQTDNPIMPLISQFRAGETETMGIIEKVSYKVDGNSVIVSYKDGLMKGSSIRYQLMDTNTVNNGMGLMHRIK